MTVTRDPIDAGEFEALSDVQLLAAIRVAGTPDVRRAAAWAFWLRHEGEIRKMAMQAAFDRFPGGHDRDEFEQSVLRSVQEKLGDETGLARCPAFVPWQAWVRRVTMNAAVDQSRRYRARPQHGRSKDAGDMDLRAEVVLPEVAAMRADAGEKTKTVMKAIGSQPGRDRWMRALLMEADGHTKEEIARHFGVSVVTVFAWLKLGKQAIRAELAARYKVFDVSDLLTKAENR